MHHFRKTGLILGAVLFANSSFGAVSPSSVQVTVYAVAVSQYQDCSNPTIVGNYPEGQIFDFKQNPAIFNGTVPQGTYPCVILQMSDVITFIPAESDGVSCVSGTTYSASVCRPSNSGQYTPMTISLNNAITYGTTTACTGNDVVTTFISTLSTGVDGLAFLQPDEDNIGNGLTLGSPFIVSGTSAGTFVVDFDNQIASNGGNCTLNRPSMTFR